MNKQAIQLMYTCDGCGLKDRRITVEARTTEDILPWMDSLKLKISEDHQRVSPRCRATKMANVKIPIGNDRIGGSEQIT